MSAAFGMGSGMIVEHVRCNGTERQLTECTITDSHDGQCSHSQDAGVRCCELSNKLINASCSESFEEIIVVKPKVNCLLFKHNYSFQVG